jgi:hypothetical protein
MMIQGKLLITLLMMAAVLSVNGQSKLIGYWSFDESSGDTIYDQSGNGYHGTINGAERVPGIKGQAISFKGNENNSIKNSQASGDYAEITGAGSGPPDILSELEYGSISIWFRVEEIPTEYGIAPLFYYGMSGMCDFFDAANKGLILELGHSPIFPGSRELFFTIWKNGCTFPSFCYDTGFPVSEGEWHHFVAVVGEDYNTGYFDGEELTQRDYNFGGDYTSQFFADALAHEELWLGRGHWDGTTQFFKGEIDELRIYSKPLSKEDVKRLYATDSSVITNIKNPDIQNKIKVYPNPAIKAVHYEIQELKGKIDKIRIININGKIVSSISEKKYKGKIDTGNFPNGIYFMEVHGKNTTYRKKFIIRK